MKTKKLYEADVYKNTCLSKITSVAKGNNKSDNGFTLTFDQTVFFPEGGGQSSDIGRIKVKETGNTYLITDVQEEGDEIIHYAKPEIPKKPEPHAENNISLKPENTPKQQITAEPESSNNYYDDTLPKAGMTAELEINWSHRFDNMQRHSGEHILSGAMYRLFGAVNRGFHMSDDFMVIDFELPKTGWDRSTLSPLPENALQKDKIPTRITWKMAEEAELEANRVIWRDSIIHTSHFAKREDAEKLPLRKHLAFDEDISIVTIGELPRPDDCCPCCGTHPSSAGQVGLIKIYKIEPNKGMSRLYMEAGKRAFKKAQKHYDDFYDIAVEMSAGTDDAAMKFHKLVEKSDEMHYEVRILRQKLTDIEAEKIIDSPKSCITAEYHSVTSDDLFNIAKKLEGHIIDYAFLVDVDNSMTVVVANTDDGYNAGKFIKENAGEFSGRGGGKPFSAMVKFPDMNNLHSFIDFAKSTIKPTDK